MALLKGKTALVTGASAGIGQSTVRWLSAAAAISSTLVLLQA